MRQAGVLAAAGIYALDNIAPKLYQDHANAQTLAKGEEELFFFLLLIGSLLFFKLPSPSGQLVEKCIIRRTGPKTVLQVPSKCCVPFEECAILKWKFENL